MEVISFAEWDIPKDEARRNKYVEFMRETAWIEKMHALVNVRHRAWTDSTGGHIMYTAEYESAEDFAKIWNELDYHRRHARFYRIVDNFKMRVCRPAALSRAALDTMTLEEIDEMKE